MKNKKVVITGMGVYSPIGKNQNEVLDSLLNSKSGLTDIQEFSTEGLRNSKGGVIQNIDNIETTTGARSSILFQHAVDQAMQDSKFTESDIDLSRVSISVGSSLGGMDCFVDWLFKLHENQSENTSTLNKDMKLDKDESVLFIPGILLAKDIAKRYGISGGLSTSITACSASGNAFVKGVDNIRSGVSDVVVLGFVEPLSQLSFMGFHTLMAMTKGELKPLDDKRSGLLIGEGAACLILESEEHAKKRKAKAYAEIAGYGVSNDAYHSTQPHPNGDGAVTAINKALKDSNTSNEEIQYINVHGTGTKHNDITEVKALNRVFGEKISEIPISSTKSFLGHTLGASGGIEALVCILALYNDFIPPSLNFTESIEGFNYKVATKAEKNIGLQSVISNSFGFGGNAVSLVFKKLLN